MKREVSSNARTDGKARTGQPGREINREESRENSGKAFEICNRHLPAPVDVYKRQGITVASLWR